MRVLLDTNIIINREDDKIIEEDLQILLSTMSSLRISIVLHPKSIEDIKKDKDTERKKIILSKFKTYALLEDFPRPTTEFYTIIGKPVKQNDIIDSYMLIAVNNNAINFLITEDNGIHRKAKLIGISDRVLKIIEALEIFKEGLPREIKLPPALRETAMSSLDINDPIFDSLRMDYPDFNKWFMEKCQEGRKCWINTRNNGLLGAILIFKTEKEPIPSLPPLPKKNRLKISNMKVSHVGHKIGELLLRKCFELAVRNNLPELYLTHFTKEDDYLVELIQEYGFDKVAVLDQNWTEIPEDVYLKKLIIDREDIKNVSPHQISKTFFPNLYDGKEVNKFLIPIQPQFYERLFTDYPGRQTTLNEHTGEFIIEGNTIMKAYLSRSSSKKMEIGDLIIFYRSQDVKSLLALGIIEMIYYDLIDPLEIVSIVGRRTVYTLPEIEKISQSPITIILFNHHFYFKRPISYRKLLDLNIVNGPIQSITEIDHEKYIIIKKEGVIDERFTFN